MATILITGGTGLIGKRLSYWLEQKGHSVRHLSRSERPQAKYPTFKWDIAGKHINPEALTNLDYVIHLAGAGIADKPWTNKRKALILSSRVESSELLAASLAKQGVRPKAILAASAVGYYGNRGDEWLDEQAKPGTGFLADTCVAWEEATEKLGAVTDRLIKMRIGIVMSTQGGALEKMLLSFKFGAGTYFGNGRQYMPWIHIDDLCGQFIFALENPSVEGIYNSVGPNPVTSKEMAKGIKKALRRPALILPAPEAALRLAMGEMADVVMISTRAKAEKIQSAGYVFQHPDLVEAINHLKKAKL